MHVLLSPQSAEFVRQMVESGRYGSADEVMEDALVVLGEQNRLERLRALVAEGDDDDRDDLEPFTPELAARLRQEALEMHRRGERPDPDICP